MDAKKYNISVCMIARPTDDITECVNSLKNQTFPYYELVIHREIGKFSELRNKVIDKAQGEIIAFIDSDCHAEKHWLEEINKIFQNKEIIGFFGKVCYELGGNVLSASTRVVTNDGQDTMTANAGFRTDILKDVRFDEEIDYLEDKILFERIKKRGKIIYSSHTIVFHEYQEWNFWKAIKYAKKIEDFLKAREKYNFSIQKVGPIICPQHYLIILFPPILLFFEAIKKPKDLKIVLAKYLEKIYTRVLIWKYSIKNKKFFI